MKKFLFGLLFATRLMAAVDAPGHYTGKPGLDSGLALGSVSAPSLFFTGDSNTGFYSTTADAIAATAGGSKVLLLQPAAASYSVELGVSGSTKDFLFNNAGINLVGTVGSTYPIYRGSNTGILRFIGGAGIGSAYHDLYGGSHATKPGYHELSNNAGIWLQVNDTGAIRFFGQYVSPIHTETGMTGTAHTVDWANANDHILDLQSFSGDVTLTLSNPIAGAWYSIKFIQSSTARAVTWPAAVKWPGGTPPTISVANDAIDLVKCLYDGSIYLCTFSQAFG